MVTGLFFEPRLLSGRYGPSFLGFFFFLGGSMVPSMPAWSLQSSNKGTDKWNVWAQFNFWKPLRQLHSNLSHIYSRSTWSFTKTEYKAPKHPKPDLKCSNNLLISIFFTVGGRLYKTSHLHELKFWFRSDIISFRELWCSVHRLSYFRGNLAEGINRWFISAVLEPTNVDWKQLFSRLLYFEETASKIGWYTGDQRVEMLFVCLCNIVSNRSHKFLQTHGFVSVFSTHQRTLHVSKERFSAAVGNHIRRTCMRAGPSSLNTSLIFLKPVAGYLKISFKKFFFFLLGKIWFFWAN